jgi:hypothetical protein
MMDLFADRADVFAGGACPSQQHFGAGRRSRRAIRVEDSEATTFLAQVFAQELTGLRIDESDP